jgi:hypothetical protein
MRKYLSSIRGAILVVVLMCVTAAFVSCAPSEDSKLISMVKEGTLSGYPNKTVGKAADSFLGNPKWSVQRIDGGGEYVTVTGAMTVAGQAVQSALQFHVDKDKGAFVIQALEINGVAQGQEVINALIEKMNE